MIRKTLAALTLAALASTAHAASVADAAEVIDLWPSGNPGGWATEGDEINLDNNDGIARVKNVNRPTLAYFPADPDKATDAAMIVAPGGGYSILAIDHEGYAVAEYLASQGIHAFVLKYRLPRKGQDTVRHAPGLQDAQRAISLVRAQAAARKIAPDKIGLMGFSAGGHLAAVTSTAFAERSYEPVDDADKQSPRPDFAGLIYPAYLVGKNDPSGKLTDDLTLSKDIPPTFFVHAQNDGVTCESSIFYYLALKRLGVPAEMHLFPEGGHGYGITKAKDLPVSTWPQLIAAWVLHTTK